MSCQEPLEASGCLQKPAEASRSTWSLVCPGMVRAGLVRVGLVRAGLVDAGLVRAGLVRFKSQARNDKGLGPTMRGTVPVRSVSWLSKSQASLTNKQAEEKQTPKFRRLFGFQVVKPAMAKAIGNLSNVGGFGK